MNNKQSREWRRSPMKALSGGVLTTLIFHSVCSAGGPALVQDAKAGAAVLKKCARYHSADGSNRVGSILAGVVGREPSTAPGLRYRRARQVARTSVVSGTRGSERVDIGGRRISKNK